MSISRGASNSVPGAHYHDTKAAAALLGMNEPALRARCRRAARREGRNIIARLGGGIVAVKFGTTWRVLFPEHDGG